MIKVKEVVFNYGEEPVIVPITFEVVEKSFVSVIGKSGCGKTTLLRLISGLLEPHSGKITVDGHEVVGPAPGVGLMFQKPNLLPWKNVIQNILLPISLRRKVNLKDAMEARSILNDLGLFGSSYDKYPHELSEGMKQRVSLARLLIDNPRVLLLDEPFAAVDTITRWNLRLLLQRLWLKHKKTVLLVTHDIAEAVLLSDKVLVMTHASESPDSNLKGYGVSLERPRTKEDLDSGRFGKVIRQLEEML